MSNDFFGGLGGLMKGFSGLMPQDDPAVKVFNAQAELEDLKKQEMELYAEIGKKALTTCGDKGFPEISARLRLVQENQKQAESRLSAANAEQRAQEQAEQQAKALRICPACGTENPDGIKFCQECGTRLGVSTNLNCPACDASNPPGTRFCGECGNRLQEE